MPFPTAESFIAAAEAQLGLRLPAELRTHLLKSNGGEVEFDDDHWKLHPVFDSTDRKHAGRTADHIVRETQQAKRWTGFPPEPVVIAGNGTGDCLVLLPDPSNPSQLGSTVSLWNHETKQLTGAGTIEQLLRGDLA